MLLLLLLSVLLIRPVATMSAVLRSLSVSASRGGSSHLPSSLFQPLRSSSPSQSAAALRLIRTGTGTAGQTAAAAGGEGADPSAPPSTRAAGNRRGGETSLQPASRSHATSLLPFHGQFPSLTSLLPSPLRALFRRGERDRDPWQEMLRDPFFATLSPLSPALPLAAGVLPAVAPLVSAMSRGVWDVDAELANPIQGVEVDETDDAIVMKTKLAPGISRRDVHLKLEATPDGHPVLHLWGEVKREERDKKRRAERFVYSSFQRFIILPDDVDPAHVEAVFEPDNSLRIVMPKKPQERLQQDDDRDEIKIRGKDEGAAERQIDLGAGAMPGTGAGAGAAAAAGGPLPGAKVARPSAQV